MAAIWGTRVAALRPKSVFRVSNATRAETENFEVKVSEFRGLARFCQRLRKGALLQLKQNAAG